MPRSLKEVADVGKRWLAVFIVTYIHIYMHEKKKHKWACFQYAL